ncbi:MAG: helix-turn-helix domain-containing protein [Oscillospiraceae bacterium]|nr:helix-turn-helix domain-containing protein [Oscillospiraceae bacterium]
MHVLLFESYPDLVNIEQMCEMLGNISKKSGYKLLKEKKIKSIIIAKRYKIPKIYILEYLELSDTNT